MTSCPFIVKQMTDEEGAILGTLMLTPDVSLRKARTLDGEEVVSVVDVLTFVLQKDATKAWNKIKSDKEGFKKVQKDIKRARVRRGDGRNCYEVDCMTYAGFENLLLILKGTVGDAWRKIVLDAFRREEAKKNGTRIEHNPHGDKKPHELEVQTMKIAFDRQQYAFDQDKLDRETARKNEERKTASFESFMETKKAAKEKVAAAKEAKFAAETSMIVFDLEQKKATVAVEAAKTASAAPTPAKEKAKPAEWGFLMHNKGTAGIRKRTSTRAKKGARGEELVLTKQTTEREFIKSHFSRK